MTNEMGRWFEKQSKWQHDRIALSWPEKIRQAEEIRESIGRWRKSPLWNSNTDLSHQRTTKGKS